MEALFIVAFVAGVLIQLGYMAYRERQWEETFGRYSNVIKPEYVAASMPDWMDEEGGKIIRCVASGIVAAVIAGILLPAIGSLAPSSEKKERESQLFARAAVSEQLRQSAVDLQPKCPALGRAWAFDQEVVLYQCTDGVYYMNPLNKFDTPKRIPKLS